MSDFEKYIEAKYPNRSPKIPFQKFKDIDGTLFYGIKEVEDQAEAWNHQQAIIDNLKTQLNNMEACYIGMKKERDALQARIENVNQSLGEMVAVSENLHSSWYVLHDAADLCKAEGIDQCVSEINKALRGDL